MAFTPEQEKRILDAINAKTHEDTLAKCPLCTEQRWLLGGGFVSLPVSDRPGLTLGARQYFPLVVVICANCGNTQLVNLHVLGLGDIAERKDIAEKQPGQVAPDSETKGEGT